MSAVEVIMTRTGRRRHIAVASAPGVHVTMCGQVASGAESVLAAANCWSCIYVAKSHGRMANKSFPHKQEEVES